MTRKKSAKKRTAKKKSAPRRLTAAERAKRSGFWKKLDAWLTANANDRDAGAIAPGPHSCERLAKVITALGEPVTPPTVYRWRDGKVLPDARYIPALERLLAAPFGYLDNARTTWPRRWDRAATWDLLQQLPDEDAEALAQDLRRALERRGGPSRHR